ncbi:MAG: hypothetical protein HC913_21220 [Microscillaceae bacterium]|nr:hypothetical protein [Microscillaceae bacterium]
MKKITLSDGSYSTFEYNAKGLLQKRVNKLDDGSLETILYAYDAKDRISKIKTGGEGSEEYRLTYAVDAYGNEVLQKAGHYVSNILVNEYKFYFNAQKQLILQEDFIVLSNGQDEKISKIEFSYHQDGNLKEERHFQNNLGTTEMEWYKSVYYEEYDDQTKPDALSDVHPLLPIALIMKNNPLQISTVGEAGLDNITEKYEFTYDAVGKPLTVKIRITGGINLQLEGSFQYH